MLDRVQAGDTMMFEAEKCSGAIVLTEIQPRK